MRVVVRTLGCKVNQCDSDRLAELLARAGFDVGPDAAGVAADVYVVNTCTVTGASDKKSAQALRKARRRNPGAVVAACGCLANRRAGLPDGLGLDFVFDARNPEGFIGELERLRAANPEAGGPAGALAGRTRAFVKAQDGCRRFCAYCIVPYARGPSVSRAKADVLREISRRIEAGAREVVLTGVDLASYCDAGGGGFAELLREALLLPGMFRLRLSSIGPGMVDADFLAAAAVGGKLCQHFHLPLQSGSDAVLSKMKRDYTAESYAAAVGGLRRLFPGAAITTDAMVGFPGESERCFLDTYSLAEKTGFADMHVFEYSKRNGTEAALYSGQIPDGEKKERSRKLLGLAREMKQAFLESLVGKPLEVLFENGAGGLSREYARVDVRGGAQPKNAVRRVLAEKAADGRIVGSVDGLAGPPDRDAN